MRPNKLLIITISSITIIIIITVIIFIARGRTAQTAIQPWTVQKTTDYTVSHPKDWSFKKSDFAGGAGSLSTIEPTQPLEEKPAIIIQTTYAAQTPLGYFDELFTKFGYQKTSIIVAGIQANQYSGGINTNSVKRQEVAVIFQKDTKIYLIKLAYGADTKNLEYEKILSDLITGLKFD